MDSPLLPDEQPPNPISTIAQQIVDPSPPNGSGSVPPPNLNITNDLISIFFQIQQNGSMDNKTTDMNRGSWSPQEDELLTNAVNQFGPKKWTDIAKLVPSRTSKQCRERWFNHLNQNVIKTSWSYQEDLLIFEQYKLNGPKWAMISKMLPGRTDNAVKNRYHSSIAKRIKVMSNGVTTLLKDTSKRNHFNKKEVLRPPPIIPPAELTIKSNVIKTNNVENHVEKERDGDCQQLISPTYIRNALDSFKGIDSFTEMSIIPSPFSPGLCSYFNNENPDVMSQLGNSSLDHLFSPIKPDNAFGVL